MATYTVFTVCFAAWGLISAFAPYFRQMFQLSATQTAFLVAVPVLLGSLARIPLGMLADGFGGRIVFTLLMFFVIAPVAMVPSVSGCGNLLLVAFFLGMAGSSFAVGVGYVSRWFSIESQGSALGVYGLGNIGQSAAVFLGPVAPQGTGSRLLGNVCHPSALGECLRDLGAKCIPGTHFRRMKPDSRRPARAATGFRPSSMGDVLLLKTRCTPRIERSEGSAFECGCADVSDLPHAGWES